MPISGAWRSCGSGAGKECALLQALLKEARAVGYAAVALHAQVHALEFYRKHGFAAHGPEFLEAGIPHRAMTIEFEGSG
jgi:predicted GNAT family N-acyltransferase